MSNCEQNPPAAVVNFQIELHSIETLSERLLIAFSRTSAEAQLLERAIKHAIIKDVEVYAKASAQASFLEVLERATLGQAKNIAIGSAFQKEIAECVGFFAFVKMQWHAEGREETHLARDLKEAVDRRNKIAHELLAKVIFGELSEDSAVSELNESQLRFVGLRQLVTAADFLSSRFGAVATDGSSLPRFKATG